MKHHPVNKPPGVIAFGSGHGFVDELISLVVYKDVALNAQILFEV